MKNQKQYSEKLDLKEEFLEADRNYKSGQLSQNKYQEVIYKVLTNLLRGYSAVEPYYTEFKEAAEKQENFTSSKVETKHLIKRHSGIEFLKERYLQADRDCKSKRSTQYDFQEVTYEVLINLLINHSAIEPYYTEFKEAADKQPWPNLGRLAAIQP